MEEVFMRILQIHRQILPVERKKNKYACNPISFVLQKKNTTQQHTTNLTKTIHAKRRGTDEVPFFFWRISDDYLFFFVKVKAGKFAAHYTATRRAKPTQNLILFYLNGIDEKL